MAAAAFLLVGFAGIRPSAAIETGAPPNLPPPPPPPLTAWPPGTGGGGAPAPKAAPARSSQPATAPATVSSASTASPSAEQPSGEGPHALDTRFFAAALLGYSSDYLDFGIGLRAGKTLDNHLYLGGSFVYQAGESGGGTVVTPVGTSNYSWSSSAIVIGPEAGYDFDLKYVVLRPYMGLGLAAFTGSASGGGASYSSTGSRFVVWPGAQVVYSLPESPFFLAGDLHFTSVPGGPAVGFFASGGMHFGT
jgi:hypothetical protein